MAAHKFRVGEVVDFISTHVAVARTVTRCEILRQLASDDDDLPYRVRGVDRVERVVRESQLQPSSALLSAAKTMLP
jgi:hypothetical protein